MKSRVKKIILDRCREYQKMITELDADEIYISRTATCTSEEKLRAERMNHTVQHVVTTMLIRLGARESLWGRCLYALYEAQKRVVKVGAL